MDIKGLTNCIYPTGSGSSTTSGCADLDSLCSSDSQLPTPVGTAPPDSQLPTPVGNAPPNTYEKKILVYA